MLITEEDIENLIITEDKGILRTAEDISYVKKSRRHWTMIYKGYMIRAVITTALICYVYRLLRLSDPLIQSDKHL